MSKTLNTILTLVGGGALVGGGYLAYTKWQDTKADNKPEREPSPAATEIPDEPVTPNSTGYKRIDALLSKLRQVAQDTGIPLGLMIGWIARESAGKLTSAPPPLKGESDSERGYFQLTPSESKSLGLDHQRLSTDSDYSIDPGYRIIQRYIKQANQLAIAPSGSSYYWRLVKLLHTMGSGATKKIIDGAKNANSVDSWESLRQHAVNNNVIYLHATGHSPAKWFPVVDDVYRIGKPFGFGQETPLIAGNHNIVIGYVESLKPDLSQDLEALSRAIESSVPKGTLSEKQAVAWVCRNRAKHLAVSIYTLLCPQGPGPLGNEGRTFCSTRCPPSAEAAAIAKAVLSLPDAADPTQNAIDFWLPDEQHLTTAQGGPSYEQARAALTASGLKIASTIGRVELLTHA